MGNYSKTKLKKEKKKEFENGQNNFFEYPFTQLKITYFVIESELSSCSSLYT